MSSTSDPKFQARCPECNHTEASLIVSSDTVLTLKCTQCRHTWAIERSALSLETTERIRSVGGPV
jgi:transcription elongation factor Elf1